MPVDKKWLWGFLLVFLIPYSMPVYWYLHVWRAGRPFRIAAPAGKSLAKMMLMSVAVALTILVAWLCWNTIRQRNGNAHQAENAFLEDLGKANIAGAYGRTSRSYQLHHSFSEFQAMIKNHPLLLHINEPTLRRLSMKASDPLPSGHASGLDCLLDNGKESISLTICSDPEHETWKVTDLLFHQVR
jgi:hypothetical protein